MSQTPYNLISHGSVAMPMDTYVGETQRIIAPPEPWCNLRRTLVIIAVISLTILYVVVVIFFTMVRVMEHK